MADEDDKKSSDEYKYPDEYYSGDEYKPAAEDEEITGGDEPLEESPVQAQRRRRIFYVLGLIGAIAIVYSILTFMTRRTTDMTAQVTPPITTPTPVAVTPTAPPAPPPVVTTTTASVPDEVEQSMQQQIRTNQQVIASLQSQMQQLQADLAQLTENLTTLTGQIQILANEIKAVEMRRNIVESKKLLRFPTMQIYHLKALVPGRAWLQSLSGQVTTVTLGDRLAGYGIVQSIDVEQGIVTTSSGKLIQYGPKDS